MWLCRLPRASGCACNAFDRCGETAHFELSQRLCKAVREAKGIRLALCCRLLSQNFVSNSSAAARERVEDKPHACSRIQREAQDELSRERAHAKTKHCTHHHEGRRRREVPHGRRRRRARHSSRAHGPAADGTGPAAGAWDGAGAAALPRRIHKGGRAISTIPRGDQRRLLLRGQWSRADFER